MLLQVVPKELSGNASTLASESGATPRLVSAQSEMKCRAVIQNDIHVMPSAFFPSPLPIPVRVRNPDRDKGAIHPFTILSGLYPDNSMDLQRLNFRLPTCFIGIFDI